MPEENNAAQVDPLDAFVQEAIDQGSEQNEEVTPATESAPVEVAKETEIAEVATPEGEAPKANKVQERMNKLTADKHDERRKREASDKRADELQKQLDSIEANKPTLEKPSLEDDDINFDEDLFNKRSVAYEVQEQVKAELATQKTQAEQSRQQAETAKTLEVFNEKVKALEVEDWDAKAGTIPDLPDGVAHAIIGLDNGAEIIQHLFTNLDQADSLAGMSPMSAMMEIGKISSSMSVKPEIKTSAAPDPIEPVSAGSSLNSNIDDEMSIDAWMAKYN